MSDYSATLNTKTITEGELPEKTHSVIRKTYEIFNNLKVLGEVE